MAERIGADHGEVEASASAFDLSGDLATQTGTNADGYARDMEGSLDRLMVTLGTHFEQLAADLGQRVADHKGTLEATDWAGASKDNAIQAEAALSAETDRVLEQALEQVAGFRESMHGKAEAFRAAIESEFRVAMTATDEEYRALASASRSFASNLAAADQTIKYG